jgi:hypothetical protein
MPRVVFSRSFEITSSANVAFYLSVLINSLRVRNAMAKMMNMMKENAFYAVRGN